MLVAFSRTNVFSSGESSRQLDVRLVEFRIVFLRLSFCPEEFKIFLYGRLARELTSEFVQGQVNCVVSRLRGSTSF